MSERSGTLRAVQIKNNVGTGKPVVAVALGLFPVVAIASCSSTASRHSESVPSASASPAPPLTDAQLRQRLITKDSLPAEFDLLDFSDVAPSDGPDPSPSPASSPGPVDAIPCSDVRGPVFLGDMPAPAGQATIGVHGHTGRGWFGNEWLASYPGDGAKQILDDLRSVVKRCPSYSDDALAGMGFDSLRLNISLTSGPKLGDESLRLQIREPSKAPGIAVETDSIYIRDGHTLMLLDEQATIGTTAQPSPLTQVATIAFAKLT
ncbi:hypothetical protein [Rugosimonospora africana]|uniref:PknH-like extracellular domain-containing protein n=1 Tax=Rugosimonospora africana TaxID=556532 RepID=A0A8J3QW47_9ACTN|nr:hypothetical protein [Rugosimonospora africana]GIH17192.1 hypothetical protein Raf01_53640 [Rugosimonospora africana]